MLHFANLPKNGNGRFYQIYNRIGTGGVRVKEMNNAKEANGLKTIRQKAILDLIENEKIATQKLEIVWDFCGCNKLYEMKLNGQILISLSDKT